jgi:hypothetical protein
LVSVEGFSESKRCFGAFISARKIPFPENGDSGSQRPVRNPRLLESMPPKPPNLATAAAANGSGVRRNLLASL